MDFPDFIQGYDADVDLQVQFVESCYLLRF